MKNKTIALTLAAMLAAGVAAPTAVIAQPIESGYQEALNQFDQKAIRKIDVDRIYNHIATLSEAPRVAGTDVENRAVDYLRDEFKSYGYDVEVQPFTYVGYTEPTRIELDVPGHEGELNPGNFTYGISGDVTAGLVDAGIGSPADFEGIDAEGKIAVVQRGEFSFAEKIVNAADAGAAGVVIYNNGPGALNGTLGGHDDRFVPAVSLSQEQGQSLLQHMNGNPGAEARILVEGAETGEHTSHNVIATKHPTNKKKDTGEVIVIGSHMDSVPGAPGANDNASGTAVTLELARAMKNLPSDTEIRFASFGAEELGLIGSHHYVSELSDTEKDRIIANFNLDMVGSRDAGDLIVASVDGEPNLVTELTQKASAKLNGEPTTRGRSGSSDHVPFHQAGIPAALFIHSPLEPWYHTPQDTLDKISKEKLLDVAEIVAAAVYDRARFDNQNPKDKKRKETTVPKEAFFEQSIR
ncbi:Zn-dependent amino-or carboxypeptidase, M28 family [Bhargavaea ginsengi]|uniref:Zn-dependent amino-or carboxypeptidase, M28 family n=1 Tax=Bhargavaea ginsengi TaxID=426757 RepID=A0A1H6WQJ1_9BACL|nr:M20/M25/M40 family metallo-hydrolase [Bhargavaea ginsengi]SEJ14615.1 Zn-dependent amino-or carboxypeptidase, M28 family [Bhargavaea ginsengi]